MGWVHIDTITSTGSSAQVSKRCTIAYCKQYYVM